MGKEVARIGRSFGDNVRPEGGKHSVLAARTVHRVRWAAPAGGSITRVNSLRALKIVHTSDIYFTVHFQASLLLHKTLIPRMQSAKSCAHRESIIILWYTWTFHTIPDSGAPSS